MENTPAPIITATTQPDFSNLVIRCGDNKPKGLCGNNPAHQTGNIYGMFYAQHAPDVKANILDTVDKCLRQEKSYYHYGPHILTELLNNHLYAFDATPNMIVLPRDSAVVAANICANKPDEFQTLSNKIINAYLGNRFSSDGQYMVGIGQSISTDTMRKHFPKAMAAIFNEAAQAPQYGALPAAAQRAIAEGRPILRRDDEQSVKWIFARAMTMDDLPALITLSDDNGADCGSSDLALKNWTMIGHAFDGLSHGRIAYGSMGTQRWRELNLHNDFVKAHMVYVGTVADLFCNHDLQWPTQSAPTQTTTERLLNHLTKNGRAKNALNDSNAEKMIGIRNDLLGSPSLTKG